MVKAEPIKVSIITATYNCSSIIDGCIESVDQQIVVVEHLIIDGGSKDGTVELLMKVYGNNRKILSESDSGIYDALNKGIRLASGEYIGILNSDDVFASKETLSRIYELFQKTDADIVYGDLKYVSKNDLSKVIRYWRSCPFHSRLLLYGWMPAHPTVFMRKTVFDKHGLYDDSFRISADYEFMLRIFSDETLKKVYLPEVITLMRLGGASNKSIRNILRKTHEDFRALKKNGFKFPCFTLIMKNVSKIRQFFY